MKKINVLRTSKGLLVGVTFLFSTYVAQAQVDVQLIKFSAECHGDYSYVNWVTANEVNADYYFLERSEDQVNWTPVDMVQAENLPGTETVYQATDNTPSISGVNFYRLTIVGVYGDVLELSDEGQCAIEVNSEDPGIISIPNPTTGKIKVVLPVTGTFDIYMLTDRTGHVLKKGITNSRDLELDMDDLDEGMYFLFIGDNANPVKIWKR